MTQRFSAQSRATQATAEALIALKIEARRDGIITDEEAQVISLVQTAVDLNELQDVADELASQLRRIPDVAPNRHLMDRIRDVSAIWQERRRSFGSDGAARRDALLHPGDGEAA